jgi:hypothetical protein
MLIMTAACIAMSWLGAKIRAAKRQKEAVALIKTLGGQVQYDYEGDSLGRSFTGTTEPRQWLRDIGGDDVFANVTWVRLDGSSVTDADLEQLKGMSQLHLLALSDTPITDAGLEHIASLTQLNTLYLNRTVVTDEGVKRLQQALPNCVIHPRHVVPRL